MSTSSTPPSDPGPSKDENPAAPWGATVGAALGLAVSFFAGPWLAMTIAGGFLGFIVGALIDRNRS